MGMLQLIILLFGLIFGLLTSSFATKRGRSPLPWFIAGFMFGIFGLATLLLLPLIKKKSQQTIVKKTAPQITRSDAWLKLWYYLDPNHSQKGPIEFPELIQSWKARQIGESTFIWGEGMAEWKRLRDQPDIITEIEQAP